MNNLKEIQARAHAAWASCPDKNRAEKARLEAELAAATRAVADAKRAAQPAPTKAAVDAAINAAIEASARAEAAIKRGADLDRAAALYRRAQEYPRCGEGWPYPGREEAADALLRANPEFAEGLEE